MRKKLKGRESRRSREKVLFWSKTEVSSFMAQRFECYKKFPNAAGLDLPCLLFHPVMDSINLNLFRARGETIAFCCGHCCTQ